MPIISEASRKPRSAMRFSSRSTEARSVKAPRRPGRLKSTRVLSRVVEAMRCSPAAAR